MPLVFLALLFLPRVRFFFPGGGLENLWVRKTTHPPQLFCLGARSGGPTHFPRFAWPGKAARGVLGCPLHIGAAKAQLAGEIPPHGAPCALQAPAQPQKKRRQNSRPKALWPRSYSRGNGDGASCLATMSANEPEGFAAMPTTEEPEQVSPVSSPKPWQKPRPKASADTPTSGEGGGFRPWCSTFSQQVE